MLKRVHVDNDGTDFGIAGESIGAVAFRVDGVRFRFPDDGPPAGDFKISLL